MLTQGCLGSGSPAEASGLTSEFPEALRISEQKEKRRCGPEHLTHLETSWHPHSPHVYMECTPCGPLQACSVPRGRLAEPQNLRESLFSRVWVAICQPYPRLRKRTKLLTFLKFKRKLKCISQCFSDHSVCGFQFRHVIPSSCNLPGFLTHLSFGKHVCQIFQQFESICFQLQFNCNFKNDHKDYP